MKDAQHFWALLRSRLRNCLFELRITISMWRIYLIGQAQVCNRFLMLQTEKYQANVVGQEDTSSFKGVSESQEGLLFRSYEFITEFDKTIAKAKNLKDKSMPFGIDDDDPEQQPIVEQLGEELEKEQHEHDPIYDDNIVLEDEYTTDFVDDALKNMDFLKLMMRMEVLLQILVGNEIFFLSFFTNVKKRSMCYFFNQ